MNSETPIWADGKIIGEDVNHYHACEAVSSSKLKVFRKSPLLYWRKYIARTIEEPSKGDHFAVGQAAHSLILEGREAYERSVAISPDGLDRRTKDGKAAWEAFLAKSAGKTVISADHALMVEKMAISVRSHPAAAALLSGGVPEITWRAKVGGLRVQCRTDIFADNVVEVPGRAEPVGLRVIDLKTCESVRDGEYGCFQRQFWDLSYHRQFGFYLALLHTLLPKEQIPLNGIPAFFIAVEKQEPFQTAVFEPDQTALRIGFEEAMEDLKALRECVARDEWPGSPQMLQSLALPEWMVKRKEKELGL